MKNYVSRDTYFPFRQDSDFLYLTGFEEPESLLVLVPGRAQGEPLLFCRECDAEKEVWDGPRFGPECAVKQFGLSYAFPIDDLDDILPGLLEGHEQIYFLLRRYAHLDRRIRSYRQAIAEAPGSKGAPEIVFANQRPSICARKPEISTGTSDKRPTYFLSSIANETGKAALLQLAQLRSTFTNSLCTIAIGLTDFIHVIRSADQFIIRFSCVNMSPTHTHTSLSWGKIAKLLIFIAKDILFKHRHWTYQAGGGLFFVNRTSV